MSGSEEGRFVVDRESSSDHSPEICVTVFFQDNKIFEKNFDQFPIVVGRQSQCEISLPYTFLSRKHFQIENHDGILVISDLASRHGLRINGESQRQARIVNTAEIEINGVKIFISIKEPPSASSNEPTLINPLFQQSPSLNSRSSPGFSSPEETIIASSPSSSDSSWSSHFLLGHHPEVLSSRRRRLETMISWQEQVLKVREFNLRDSVKIGRSPLANIQIPLRGQGWKLARVNFDHTDCFIPSPRYNFEMLRSGVHYPKDKLLSSQMCTEEKAGYKIPLRVDDVLKVELDYGQNVYLRYIPETPVLSQRKLTEPDYGLRHALIGSAIIHTLLILLLLFNLPPEPQGPKIKNVPERYARLIMDSPMPPPVILPQPTLPPLPTPPPPLIPPRVPPRPLVAAKEKPPPKPKSKTKLRVKNRKSKSETPILQAKAPSHSKSLSPPRLAKDFSKEPKEFQEARHFPIKVTSVVPQDPMTPVQPKINVEELGPLALLKSSEANSPSNALPTHLNIDSKPGLGSSSRSTSSLGVPNALSSPSGKLLAMGSGSARTRGRGSLGRNADIEDVSDQGRSPSARAGKRKILGSVVGTPKITKGKSRRGQEEGLSPNQVLSKVKEYLPDIQQCYESRLLADPSLAGKIDFEWEIEPSGSVSSVRVVRSTINGGESLIDCIKDIFMKMEFPKASNGQGTLPTIGFPFGRI